MKNIHDIKLTGDSEFVDKFNAVGDEWKRANDPNLSDAERKAALDTYHAKKYCLEQGIG